MRQYESISVRNANRGAAEICSEKIQAAKRRKFFRVVAKHAYPKKTVLRVHQLTGIPERTIYDWMAARVDAPAGVMLQLFGEIARAGD